MSALVYVQTRVDYDPPSAEYLGLIRQGYADFGLDEGPLLAAAGRTVG